MNRRESQTLKVIQALVWARDALFVFALAGLVATTGLIAWNIATGRFEPYLREMSYSTLIAAMLIYLLGHLFRVLRLAMLIGGWRIGFRTAASFHFFTAATSLIFPLKSGEFYRVTEMSNILGSFGNSFIIVLWERIFDVLAVVCLTLLLRSFTPNVASSDFVVLTLVSLGFLAMCAILFFVVPDSLRRLTLLVILRYDSPKSVWWLQQLTHLRRLIAQAPFVVRGKVASLITLTAMAWACEVTSVALSLPRTSASIESALDTLVSYFAALSTGETLFSILDTADSTSVASKFLPHIIATQVPLAIVGLIAGLYYASNRRGKRLIAAGGADWRRA